MQQKVLLSALFAGSAVAIPWGPGGRWGQPASAQSGQSMPTGANPWGSGGQGGEAVVTEVHMATVVETAISQPTVTDWVNAGGNNQFGGSNAGSASTPTAVAMPPAAPTFGNTGDESVAAAPSSSPAGHKQVAAHSASPAVSSAPTNDSHQQSRPSSIPSAVAQPKQSSSAVSAAKPAATSAGSTSTAGSTDYQKQVLDSHNVHRANHSAPALSWDAGLASTAEKIAKSCKFAHDTQMDGGGYGQNIQAGSQASDVWEAITNSFYNGEVNAYNGQYGLANPGGNFEDYGHFTQVVWHDTTSVGCATVHCDGGVTNGAGTKDFTVCNYKPAGNFGGEYAKNVGKSLGKATVATNVGASSY